MFRRLEDFVANLSLAKDADNRRWHKGKLALQSQVSVRN